jgi:hypothetical protein
MALRAVKALCAIKELRAIKALRAMHFLIGAKDYRIAPGLLIVCGCEGNYLRVMLKQR